MELKLAVAKTLGGYCFICGEELTKNQYDTLKVIANFPFCFDSEEDYTTVRKMYQIPYCMDIKSLL